jgi:hypothetical protein
MTMLAVDRSSSIQSNYSPIETVGAWLLGYAYGRHDVAPVPPGDFVAEERVAFRDGWELAQIGREIDSAIPDHPAPDPLGDWLAERHRDDHDGQFCPTDLEYWALPNAEYYDAEREIEEAEAVRTFGHRAYAGEGVAR